MLSFALPWVMGAAVAAAIGIGLLHLLSVRQPPVLWLPTARFVTAGDARAVARRPRPNDLWLLVLRVAALLLAGAALAGARCHALGPRTVQLIVADATMRADSAGWWTRAAYADDRADDGEGRPARAAETSRAMPRLQAVWVDGLTTDPGVALVAAQREAARLVRNDPALEQIGLTVVVPPTVQSLRGWEAWRAEWPGHVRVVQATERDTPREAESPLDSVSRRASPSRVMVSVQSSHGDDPVTAAFGFGAAQPVIILRDSGRVSLPEPSRGALPADTLANVSTVTVHWPRDGAPSGWQRLSQPDSVGAVVAQEIALVAPFVRAYRWIGDSSGTTDSTARAILWWADGGVAAVERSGAHGCERDVYLPVADGSDLLLGAAAASVRNALTAPCGSAMLSTHALKDSIGDLVDARPFRVGQATSLQSDPWWLTPVLLLAAVGLLLGEQYLRRGEGSA
ncbi:hypothetical protein [Gemmatimonas aurantiaca]|uniref:hypothetical protein n=1 Tax=Gemmatimonas aurantiaca TaxID=173480 RepID=UPI00301C1A19